MTSIADTEKRSRVSEVIVGLVSPLIGYLIAYRFEKGFCTRFGIPEELIEVGVFQVIWLSSLCFSFLMLFFFWSGVFDSIKSRLPEPLAFRLEISLVPILVFLALVLAFDIPFLFILLGTITVLSIIIFEFAAPLVFERKTKGYVNKLEKHDVERFQKKLFGETLVHKIGRGLFRVILVGFVVVYISGILGALYAKYKVSFTTLSYTPEIVVLRKYSGNLICVEVDRKEKSYKPQFLIKTFDQISRDQIKMSINAFGPLHAAISKEITPTEPMKRSAGDVNLH